MPGRVSKTDSPVSLKITWGSYLDTLLRFTLAYSARTFHVHWWIFQLEKTVHPLTFSCSLDVPGDCFRRSWLKVGASKHTMLCACVCVRVCVCFIERHEHILPSIIQDASGKVTTPPHMSGLPVCTALQRPYWPTEVLQAGTSANDRVSRPNAPVFLHHESLSAH